MGKNRIRYRVVDEYNGDTPTPQRTRSSKRPLSLGELIEFFLAAWPLKEVLEGNEFDRDGAQDFTRPSSEVYPQFEAGSPPPPTAPAIPSGGAPALSQDKAVSVLVHASFGTRFSSS